MSDLHGSATACRKVLEAFEREKADKILLLGDILYHGPAILCRRAMTPRSASVC